MDQLDLHSLAEECLVSPLHFIVSTSVSAGKGGRKIQVVVDGDNGLDIDTCSKISRMLSSKLDELQLDFPYTLEVTSPGIDQPLTSIRQYRKNIGRKVKVVTPEKEFIGTLMQVESEFIKITQTVGKGKKAESQDSEIPFSQIKKTIVQVTF